MTKVKYISAQDFNKDTLNYDGFSIIECINNSNALLKTMESVLLKLQKSVPVPINIFRIDSQKNPFIVNKFYVLQEPTYLIFFDGVLIDRMDGIVSFFDFFLRMNKHMVALTINV
jgi:hypothetical protein